MHITTINNIAILPTLPRDKHCEMTWITLQFSRTQMHEKNFAFKYAKKHIHKLIMVRSSQATTLFALLKG